MTLDLHLEDHNEVTQGKREGPLLYIKKDKGVSEIMSLSNWFTICNQEWALRSLREAKQSWRIQREVGRPGESHVA